MAEMEGYYIKKIGQNRGKPRIWLEGSQTEKAGFKPGQRFDIEVRGKTIVLQANKDGSRVVSAKKKGDKANPVIDLNSQSLLALFDGMAAIRIVVKKGEIYLLPLASELKKAERYQRLKAKLESGDPLVMGSLSAGGGILDNAIHRGFADAGIKTRLGFANEIREELLEHASEHNEAFDKDTQLLAAPMQELAFDDRALSHLPKVEVMSFGLPCSAASVAGRARRGLAGRPEQHPEVGHLVVSALVIVNKANPAVIVMENVEQWATSASSDILRTQLKDLGYTLQERIVSGSEWNCLEDRKRWVGVACTQGIEFDFDQLIPPEKQPLLLSDALEDIPLDDPRWSEMSGLKEKQERDALEGKNFKMQVFDGSSEKIGTITKGYGKIRSTDPKIQHPENSDLLRQITVNEHAAVKQIPVSLVAGLSVTTAHEVLGQSIVYPAFRDIGATIGHTLNEFASGRSAPVRKPALLQEQPQTPQQPVQAAQPITGDLFASSVNQRANEQTGRYVGKIVSVNDKEVMQDTGRNTVVVHQRSQLSQPPVVGRNVSIQYEKGLGRVTDKTLQQSNSIER